MTRREINDNSISERGVRFPEPSSNILRISDLERLGRDTRHDGDNIGYDKKQYDAPPHIPSNTNNMTRFDRPIRGITPSSIPTEPRDLREIAIDRIDREIPIDRIYHHHPSEDSFLTRRSVRDFPTPLGFRPNEAPIRFREPTPQELGQKEKARLLRILNKYSLIDSLAGSALVLQRTTEELGKLGADTFTWTIDIALQADGLFRYGRIGTGDDLRTVTSKPVPVEDYPQYANLADEAIIKYVQAQAAK